MLFRSWSRLLPPLPLSHVEPFAGQLQMLGYIVPAVLFIETAFDLIARFLHAMALCPVERLRARLAPLNPRPFPQVGADARATVLDVIAQFLWR